MMIGLSMRLPRMHRDAFKALRFKLEKFDFPGTITFGLAGRMHVFIEAPRGLRAKYKFDPDMGAFISSAASLGISYPFDWGFNPSTWGG